MYARSPSDSTEPQSGSNMHGSSPNASDQERQKKIAMLREQIEIMTHDQELRGSRKAAGASDEHSSSPRLRSQAQFQANHDGSGTCKLVAYAVVPEKQKGTSSFTAPLRKSAIRWNTEGGASGSIEVPAVVAKAFGSDERRFTGKVELEEALDALCEDQCWKRVQAIIDKKDVSPNELKNRLSREGYTLRVAEDAVERAKQCGLIDDARYAEVYIHSKIRAGWGRNRIERELEERGISVSAIPGYPQEFFSNDSELARADVALSKKRIPDRDPYQKLVRFLIGRGFSTSVSQAAVRKRLAEAGPENDSGLA